MVAALGCGAPLAPGVAIDPQPIAGGQGFFGSMAWANTDNLIISLSPTGSGGPTLGARLVILPVSGGGTRALASEEPSADCDIVDEHSPVRLDDGTIAYRRDCYPDAQFIEPMSVWVLDLSTARRHVAYEMGDPWTAEGWRTRAWRASFRAGTADGLVGVGSGMCDGIGPISDTGIQAFDLALPGTPDANLADVWTKPSKDIVNARHPAWSPDGSQLAFFVAPGSRGRDGWDRLDQPYDLLMLDWTSRAVRTVARGLAGPFGL
jgi:hypothetical protein